MTAKVDWELLIGELLLAHKISEVARRVGVTRPCVYACLHYSTQPLHHTGEALIELWCETTGRTRNQLPREETLTQVA